MTNSSASNSNSTYAKNNNSITPGGYDGANGGSYQGTIESTISAPFAVERGLDSQEGVPTNYADVDVASGSGGAAASGSTNSGPLTAEQIMMAELNGNRYGANSADSKVSVDTSGNDVRLARHTYANGESVSKNAGTTNTSNASGRSLAGTNISTSISIPRPLLSPGLTPNALPAITPSSTPGGNTPGELVKGPTTNTGTDVEKHDGSVTFISHVKRLQSYFSKAEARDKTGRSVQYGSRAIVRRDE